MAPQAYEGFTPHLADRLWQHLQVIAAQHPTRTRLQGEPRGSSYPMRCRNVTVSQGRRMPLYE
jgi:hypothetical protein